MVKFFSPPYGTALEYGFGISSNGPFCPSSVYGSEFGRTSLTHLTRAFLMIGVDRELSIDAIATHTMRCSKNFARDSVHEYNEWGVRIAREAIRIYGRKDGIAVLGTMSVMGDCYSHQSLASSVLEAEDYHHAQASALSEGGIDAFLVETVGNEIEALGLARVMKYHTLPWYLSLIVDEDGSLLDGTHPSSLIEHVDSIKPPAGYLVNCSWRTAVGNFYQHAAEAGAIDRMAGFYNNASQATHGEKDTLQGHLSHESREGYLSWIRSMIERYPSLEEKGWVSGCCGFTAGDIDFLITELEGDSAYP